MFDLHDPRTRFVLLGFEGLAQYKSLPPWLWEVDGALAWERFVAQAQFPDVATAKSHQRDSGRTYSLVAVGADAPPKAWQLANDFFRVERFEG